MSLKQLIPTPLRRVYGSLTYARPRWPEIVSSAGVGTVDLRRTLIGGEGAFDARHWADATGDPRRASMLVRDSPHVKLLEQYRAIGEQVFESQTLEQTPYFRNAALAVRLCGSYFGHRTPDGIAAQARAFVRLYERTARQDARDVEFAYRGRHSAAGSLPIVRHTLTPNAFQISDGHHRLAVAWTLGRYRVAATIVRPRSPTPLQSLVLSCAQTRGRRELYQPVDRVDFDGSWSVVRRCDDRLALMLDFLAAAGVSPAAVSVLDLACSYGWFVNEFGRRGSAAMGVDADRSALQIGRIAYGLRPEQTAQSDLFAFLAACDRRWDVVLLLSVLHHFVLHPRRSAEELLRRVDRVTGSCLFLDTGQAHERWWRGALQDWDDAFVVDFVRRHTSFSRVVPLGTDLDHTGPYRGNYGRTLFACVRTA